MSGGIHAEIAVGDPSVCQIVAYSTGSHVVTSVSKSASAGREGTVTEEFTVVDESLPALPDGGGDACEVEDVFSAGSKSVFRLSRDACQQCVCARIERAGCPVREVTAVDGRLWVTFFARDRGTLQSVLTRLDEAYDDVQVRRLLTSGRDDQNRDPVLVDLGALTDRQREVLSTAHEMGYFEHPKEAGVAEVAEALDISPSTLTEHLAAARRNLLAELTGKWS